MGRLLERIRIGIVGLGWVGQEVARAALEDPRVRLVGVADVDPTKAGRDLGEIIGEGRLGVPIDADIEAMLKRARPEVAVLCTTSDVEKLGPTLEMCVAHGAHVVTTCENLSDPDTALAQLEPGFDRRVRDANVVVLATGVNPGFAMDRLPVMLTQATRNIRRVRVVRVVNASTRRAQLQAKIGVGMTPHQFSDSIQKGEIGHAGLSSSLRLLAKGLGIVLEKTSEAFTPIIAEQATGSSILGPVKAGSVRGIYQIARGYRARREVITLELTMALDEPNPRDTIDIVGEPPLHFEGELPGDSCTIATVLSAISVIVTMPAGMRTVLDVPLEQPEEPVAPREAVIAPRAREQTQLPGPAPSMEATQVMSRKQVAKAVKAAQAQVKADAEAAAAAEAADKPAKAAAKAAKAPKAARAPKAAKAAKGAKSGRASKAAKAEAATEPAAPVAGGKSSAAKSGERAAKASATANGDANARTAGKTNGAAEPAARKAATAKSAAKPAAKSAARSAAKSDARPAAKSAARSAAKSDAKPAAKSAARSAAKSDARSAAKPAARSAAKSAVRSAAKSDAKPFAKSAARPAAKSDAKPAAKSAARPAAKSAAKPAAKSGARARA